KRGSPGTFCLVMIIMACVMTGCAALEGKLAPRKEAPVRDPKTARMVRQIKDRIRIYEDRKDFKNVLLGWRKIQEIDPQNEEADLMIPHLEKGLDQAIQKHLKAGIHFFQTGSLETSRSELLLVLFLDSDHREALKYLRKLSKIRPSPRRRRPMRTLVAEGSDFTLHTIKAGESLSILAKKYYGDKMAYGIIADFNRIQDIAKISIGQRIKIPVLKGGGPNEKGFEKSGTPGHEEKTSTLGAERYTLHTIKAGESLSKLAEKYYGDKMDYRIIADFNQIQNLTMIRIGQTIKIPVLEKEKPEEKEPFETPALDADKTGLDEKEPEEKAPEKAPVEDLVQAEDAADVVELKDEKTEEVQISLMNEQLGFEASFSEAKALFHENRFPEAIDSFERLVNANPNHFESLDYIMVSKEIVAALEKGAALNKENKYEMAYDEFNHVLDLKPDHPSAKAQIDMLVPFMIAEAKYLLHDEQSPCEAISLSKKILKRRPDDQASQNLLDEATLFEEGLELQC
ncbi:MAG: LysM peptidoglycan-binding domain-containing protein, partial [Nitrospiria bacterium]